MTTSTDRVIHRPQFSDRVRPYWLLQGCIILLSTLVGIPLVLLWLVFGPRLIRLHLAHMEVVLLEKSVKIRRGILFRDEKTIPLDKITDVGLTQGPLMRRLGLHQLRLETAGQSSQGALVSVVGIEDTEDFRERVLAQKELVAGTPRPPSPAGDVLAGGANEDTLAAIHATLLRIEDRLKG